MQFLNTLCQAGLLLPNKYTIKEHNLYCCVNTISMSMDDFQKSANWRRLIALDFDDTIAGQNTDLVARDLLDRALITPALQDLYKATGWTAYMQAIFVLLSENNYTRAQIREAIRGIEEVPGMVHLIRTLAEQQAFDVIIVSDSNAEFINVWCEKQRGLNEVLCSVFTNPACYEEDGNLLKIQPYHHQTECSLSTSNLCKGKILQEYVYKRWKDDNIGYGQIFYVGDGGNDFCPILRLGKSDFGCARIGMKLDRILKNCIDDKDERLNSQVLRWTDGYDLLNQIQQIIIAEPIVTPSQTGRFYDLSSKKI